MKFKKSILASFIILIILILGSSASLATTGSKTLYLSYFRYVYENNEYIKKDGYAYNGGHPIFQIMSIENENGTERYAGTNYYCLNALAGYTWNDSINSTVTKPATYDKSYNLESDLDILKNDKQSLYSNIAKSKYLKQILWILDNMYVPNNNLSDEQNLSQKRALLAKAGIVYDKYIWSDLNGDDDIVSEEPVYQYKKGEFDYSQYVSMSMDGQCLYYYKNQDNKIVTEVLSDELIESVQQAAIWYFTNYYQQDDIKYNRDEFNVYLKKFWLKSSNGTENILTTEWTNLNSTGDQIPLLSKDDKTGRWLDEQAMVLCSYLIDGANKYAESKTELSGSPLSMENATTLVSNKMLNNSEYYIVGPIKINEINTSVYSLSNIITVNGSENKNAYVSNSNGDKLSSQNLMDYIGKDFYISIPANNVTGNSIKIEFDGKYKTNEKILWTNSTVGEQPIVEVKPSEKPINLIITTTLNKEFDLALRKAIIKVRDSYGNEKNIINEAKNSATRSVSYVAKDILDNGTATYTHRKDPVVVENGDIVTYSITVYNEGDMAGYASQITDKLPQGLTINGNKQGTYKNGNIEYTYVYDNTTNTITFTNKSKNVLSAYSKGEMLSSETIEIECKVAQEASTTSNIYLTNIAYISKEYNSETRQDVEKDRDSYPSKYPEANQNTQLSKYNGYKGNSKNDSVYNDTNNKYYYKGEEDDDDFEIIVIKPVEFDLALQKYISSIYSNGNTKVGRQEPKIDTQKLANGTATTATYTQDKTPIKVKHGDYVTYTFRVYNEGEKDGYVKAITDNIPSGLQFIYVDPTSTTDNSLIAVSSNGSMENLQVDSNIYNLVVANNSYWSIDQSDGTLLKDSYNGEQTISITCDVDSYLGETKQDKLLTAYSNDKESNYNGSGLDSVYVTVILRVSAENGCGLTIRNEAAITEAEDKDGNKQDVTENGLIDRDSQVTKWLGKDGDKKYQDDEDFDNIILGKADIALSKFIAAVSVDTKIEDGEYLTSNGNVGTKINPYVRATEVDTTELRDNPNCHDAKYNMVKTPLYVEEQSYVLYDIRVYNEGEVDLYAGEVTDYLPNYLDYVSSDFNDNFGWKVEADGKTVKTTYLSYEKGEQNLLKAFDKKTDDGKGSGLDYRDLQILCKVNKEAPTETNLVNSSEITKYQDEDGEDLPNDVDSIPDNIKEKNKETIYEDDDDYEVIKIKKKIVDIALSKFIAAVSADTKIEDGEYLTSNGNVGTKTNPYLRATAVDTTELRDNENCHDATYIMVKDALMIPAQSYVLYDIRVYNEGETDLYAGEVTDYLPDYLDYVSCDFNDSYGWKVDTDGKTIKTTYLSFENGKQNLLKAFNKQIDDGKGSGLDYRDLQILCKVNDKAPTNTKLVNSAEITKYEDEDGDPIEKDVDSKSDNIEDKNKETKYEDDDDYEVVYIRTFDLSLLKYVTTVYVTEDGKTTTTQTGNTGNDKTDIIPKVEINRKKINSTVVKFGYTIKITNEGDIEGYAKEITDYVPEGLKFFSDDNEGWTDEGNNVISTRLLENTLLKPGESAEVTVILRWINGSNNLGLKTNVAEISEDYNKYRVPDRDSTPDNKVPGEDDIDDAQVLLAISTGLAYNIVRYATFGTIILVVLGSGITLIKKYVL